MITLRFGVEKAAVLELLSFMYKGQLPKSSTSSIAASVQLLLMADKYGVKTCSYVVSEHFTQASPEMSGVEAAFVISRLAPISNNYNFMKSLISTLKKRLVKFVGNAIASGESSRLERDLYTLPEEVLEPVLQSNNLEVDEEDQVFDAMLGWVRHNVKDEGERRAVLERLILQIRVPYMLSTCIRDVLWVSQECQTENICELVFYSLLLKSGCPPIDPLGPKKKWLWPQRKRVLRELTMDLSLEEYEAWTLENNKRSSTKFVNDMEMHFAIVLRAKDSVPRYVGLGAFLYMANLESASDATKASPCGWVMYRWISDSEVGGKYILASRLATPEQPQKFVETGWDSSNALLHKWEDVLKDET